MNFHQLNRIFHYIKHIKYGIRYLETDSVQNRILVNMLGMNHRDAELYVHKFKLSHLDPARLSETLKFLINHNYPKVEILKTPQLFQMCSKRTWEQYYLLYKECGCKKVPIKNLVKKIKFMSIKDLKEKEIIPRNLIVPTHLLTNLNVMSEDLKIDDLLDENLSLTYIHKTIVNRYLMYRLNATVTNLEKISRIYHQIYNKSMQYLSDNIDNALDLGFTKEKILKNAYILHAHPKNTREVLESLPNLAGADMRAQMKCYPKLIGLSLEHFLSIYEILKKEDISDDVIKRCINIFTLSPKTVQARLDDIRSVPETRVLMKNPRMLNLIVHYYRSKNRLSFLQQIKLKCSSLSVITNEVQHFEDYVKEGKDINKSMELIRFLQALLRSDDPQIEDDIKRHPFYLYIPFVAIEETYTYLRNKNYNNNHITSAIQILLYPKEKIETVLEKLKGNFDVELGKRISKSEKLNLVLYHLEKVHHFTGNGIWTNVESEELQ